MIKLIDNKGRIFGIINIIDLTVLLFLISTITGFSWLVYTGELFKDHDPAKKLFIEKDVEMLFKEQPSSTIKSIQDEIKKQENSETRFRIINISSIKKSNPAIQKQHAIEITSDKNLFDITALVRLKTYLDKYNNLYYYKGASLIITQNLSLEIGNTTIYATISSV